MSLISKIGDAQFAAEVINSDRLTVVDFGAAWCGPCKKLHPVMAELATEYNDKVKIVEVDVDHASDTAVQFGITSVPQLLFFKNGKVKETVIGLLPKSKIEEKIDRLLVDE
ncbi:MAG: thioredoxin [Calditrichaeota bacterium]|nr:thioredoxin [Calditrichota bacterium]